MIGALRGTVEEVNGNLVLLDVAGVSYDVTCSMRCCAGLSRGDAVRLIIHTDVKEDSIRLFGFADYLEKQVFLLLLKVSGVGAKSAADIINQVEPRELLRNIAASDRTRLQALRGVGKKTAERMIVELRDQVGGLTEHRSQGLQVEVIARPFDDAIEALISLGFARSEAERAVHRVGESAPGALTESGEVVKEALKYV